MQSASEQRNGRVCEEPGQSTESRPTSPPEQTPAAASTVGQPPVPWIVDKYKYEGMFNDVDLDRDGLVSSGDVKAIFARTCLAQAYLAHIWRLCDINSTGRLNLEQFALAMFFVEQKRQKNVEAPAELSADLIPPSFRPNTASATDVATSTSHGSAEIASRTKTSANKQIHRVLAEISELHKEIGCIEQNVTRIEGDVTLKQSEMRNLETEINTLTCKLKELKTRKGEAQLRLSSLEEQKILIFGALNDRQQTSKDENERIVQRGPEVESAAVVKQDEEAARSERQQEELRKVYSEESQPKVDFVTQLAKVLHVTDEAQSSSEPATQEIPQYDLCLGLNFECTVGHVDSPSYFWISARPCISESIEDELIQTLRDTPHAERLLQNPRVKQFCAAPYRSEYRRGRIQSFSYDSTGRRFANVLYVDHGNSAWCAADVLCKLPPALYYYQCQAVPCRLYGVESRQSIWSDEVVRNFCEFCASGSLYLLAMNAIVPSDNVYTVKLFRTTTVLDEEKEESADSILCSAFPNDVTPCNEICATGSLSTLNQVSAGALDAVERWQRSFDFLLLAAAYDADEESEEAAAAVSEPPRVDGAQIGAPAQLQGRLPASENRLVYASGLNRPAFRRCMGVQPIDLDRRMDEDGFLSLRIKRVISPDLIYASPVFPDELQARNDEQEFSKFTAQLTAFYAQDDNRIAVTYPYLEGRPFAAARLSDDDGGEAFFRCRVLGGEYRRPANGVQSSVGLGAMVTDIRQDLRVNVFYVDLGRQETDKPAVEVFLLEERFSSYPARVWKCGLFATRPVMTSSSSFLAWPREATEALNRMVKLDLPMKATVLLRENDQLGVALFGHNSQSNRATIVNNEMVKLGVARSDVQWVSRFGDKLDILNARLINLGPRISGTTSYDNIVTSAPTFVPNLASGPPYRAVTFNPQTSSLIGCRDNYLGPPGPDSAVVIQIHCMYTCLRFSATFPQGTIDIRLKKYDQRVEADSLIPVRAFEEYAKRINDPAYVAKLNHFPTPPSINDYCLARFTDDRRLYRAKILQYNEDDRDFQQVKYVDYGNMEWVHSDNIFMINMEDLLSVRFMAVECMLADLKPRQAAWTRENMNILWELIATKPQRIRVSNLLKGEDGQPLLMVELKVMDADGSYIDVNEFVAENGWAERG